MIGKLIFHNDKLLNNILRDISTGINLRSLYADLRQIHIFVLVMI